MYRLCTADQTPKLYSKSFSNNHVKIGSGIFKCQTMHWQAITSTNIIKSVPNYFSACLDLKVFLTVNFKTLRKPGNSISCAMSLIQKLMFLVFSLPSCERAKLPSEAKCIQYALVMSYNEWTSCIVLGQGSTPTWSSIKTSSQSMALVALIGGCLNSIQYSSAQC